MKPNTVFAILLGQEGVGKTEVFNKFADKLTQTDCEFCRPASVGKIQCRECDLHIIDPLHSSLPCALTWKPLNAIIVLIEFHPRVGSTMIDSFWKTCNMLKPDCLGMVFVLVTKMDRFLIWREMV